MADLVHHCIQKQKRTAGRRLPGAACSETNCFTVRHEMGLFTSEQYRTAFEPAGLTVVAYDPGAGLRHGLYVGLRI